MDLTKNSFNDQKWQTLLENLVQVLRINVCIVDSRGRSIVTPGQNLFGWKLMADTSAMISMFIPSGECLQWVDDFKMHHFAVPVKIFQNKPEIYMVVGPVILNKKLERSQYQELARRSNRDLDELDDFLGGIRVISQTSLKHIIDLIQGIAQLAQENSKTLETAATNHEDLNNILQSILGLSLGITKAQSGSIMLFDLETKELSVHAAKGLDGRYLQKSVKLDEGVAGLAFREKKTLILTDKASHNRIGHLLNRKEIRQSIVMPFEETTKKISGVLSLNITDEPSMADGNGLKRITERLSQITSFIKDVL